MNAERARRIRRAAGFGIVIGAACSVGTLVLLLASGMLAVLRSVSETTEPWGRRTTVVAVSLLASLAVVAACAVVRFLIPPPSELAANLPEARVRR